jgi:autotransporter-associated beta strand protein
VTNAGYLLTIGGTGNTTVSSAIGGSGGLTKSGSGTLTLSGSNSFTGQLTVSNGTLSIASINNNGGNGTLGNSGINQPVILGSSGNTGTLQYTAASGSSDKAFSFASGGTGGINVTTALTLSGHLYGSGNLLKSGAGTLTLTAPGVNNYNQGSANQFSGTTQISAGKISLTQLGGAGANTSWAAALWKSAYDTTGTAGAGVGIDLATATTTLALGGLAGNVDISSAVELNWGTTPKLVLNTQQDISVSYGGVISNGAANMTLDKIGPGTQILTAVNTYSGATTLGAGTLALAGAGTAQSSAFTVRGGTLLLDNTAALANRLNDTTALSLGSLSLKANVGGGTQSETVGATTFAVGGKVTVDLNGGTDQTTLALGAVTRSAGAAIDFVGVGGTLGGGAASPNVTSSSLPTNTNGILHWATVGGTQWAENNSNSIRAYSGSFTAINSSTNAQNAQVSGSESLSGARVGNSLNLIATATGQSLALGANNLTLGSAASSAAAILKSGTDAYTISGTGQVRAGSAGAGTELIAHVNGGALTISAPLATAIVGIAKGGTGDLILSGTRAGTLSGATSIAGGQLEFQGLGFTLSGVVTGAGGLTVNLNSGQALTLSNNSNSYTGSTLVKGGVLKVDFNANGLPSGTMILPGYSNTSLAGSNLVLNGGVIASSYGFARTLGAGPDQVQVLAGMSGFSVAGGGGFGLDNGRELVWGSTYFQPTTLVLGESNLAAAMSLSNGIDLAGSTRSIAQASSSYGTTLSGAIRTSSGTAGLTKTGVGELALTGSNSFNGVVTVDGGTLSVSTLANGGSNSGLGTSSNASSNLLLADGTTLKYTGAAVSTNRSFTINGTANGHGASLNASGTGAVNFTNTASPSYGTVDQTRTLTLTGTYAAANNIFAANIADNGTGAVSLIKTGAGLWVLSGNSSYTGPTTLSAGTLSVSAASNLGNTASNLVFNGGTLQISNTTNLPNFAALGRTVSFTSGQTVGLDVTSGGIFTVDQVLNQGMGGLTKAGAGTLVINSAHTYTGATTITAGTLQLNDGGSISAAPLFLNGGSFASNRTGTTTLGANTPAFISGTGGLANVGSGTLDINAPTYHTGNTTATAGNVTLSHQRAIQFSALNTTGAGSFTLTGTGSTTPIIGGLANSGTTRNLASVIDSSYASVTNLTLNPQSGTFTYGGVIADGATGMTLTKTGAGTQTLTGASLYTGATNINGGTLNLGGASATGSLASTVLNLGGGTLSYTRTGTNTQSFTTTNVNPGASTVTTSLATQTVALNSIVRSVGGTVNFGTTGSSTTTNGLSNGILGGWATANSDNWATKSGSNIVALGSYTLGNSTAATYTNANIDVATATVGGTIDTNSLRFSGASVKTLTLAAGDNIIQSGGILVRSDVGNNLSTITGGNLAGSSGGDLIIHQHNTSNSLTIASFIKNNGTATALTKSGGGTLTLSGTNTFSGGVFINAGTLQITSAANLGDSANRVTFGGSSTLELLSNPTLSQGFAINEGVTGTLKAYDKTIIINNSLAGSGILAVSGGGTGGGYFDFTSTNNTFSGNIEIYSHSGASYAGGLTLASLADTPGTRIKMSNLGIFTYGAGAVAPLVLNNRQIENAATAVFNNNATNVNSTVTVNTGLILSGGVGNRPFTLGGSNTGNNTFAGAITNGSAYVTSLTKAGAGTWVLTNANTYAGGTTLTAGNLQVGVDSVGSVGSITSSAVGTGTLTFNGGGISSNGAAARTILNPISFTGNASLGDATNTGKLTFSANAALGGATRTLTVNSVAEFSGIVSSTGAFGITKGGIGALLLSGGNTYSGLTTVSAGTLAGTQTSGTPFGTGAVTLGAGILSLTPTGSGADISVAGGDVANANVFTYNAGAEFSLNKGTNNSLTYTFSRSNAAAGFTRGTNGTLIFSVGGIANLGNTVAAGGERFLVTASATPVTLVNTLVSGVVAEDRGNSNAGDFVTYDATNGFTKASYNLTNTFTGSTNVSRVEITSPTSTGSIASYAIKANAAVTNSGTITLGSSGNPAALILNGGSINGGTLAAASGNPEFLIYTSGTSSISSAITSTNTGMSVFGSGSLTLSSSNSFTGGLRVNNSTLIVTNDNQLGGANNALTLTGGTLQTSGASLAIGVGARAITLAAGQDQTGGTFNVSSGTTTFQNSSTSSRIISGSGSLTKSGNGTLVLSGNTTNTYTGGTFANTGTLQLGATNMLADTGAVTVGGGTFDIQTFSDTVGAVTLTSGSITGTSGILTGSSYNVRSGNASAILGGSGALTKSTAGTVILTGANTYTGLTTISAGTLQLGDGTSGNDGTIANTSGLVNNGALVFNSFGSSTASYAISGTGGVTKTGAGTLTLASTNTYTGATTINNGILELSGSGSINGSNVTVNGGSFINNSSVAYTGTLTLNNASLGGGTIDGDITYSGGGTVSGSSTVTGSVGSSSGSFSVESGANLTVGTGLNVSGTAGLVIASTASVTGSINYSSSANSTIEGVIAGASQTLTKSGSSTLTLTGTNTYTGATSVDAGKLLVHGSTAAESNFTVNNGATLGGRGTIGGAVTLMSGATLSPGASIESLGLGSSVWNGGSTVQVEFSTDGSTGVAGSEWDLINITGTLDLTGASSSTPVILDLVTMLNATTSGALAVWDGNINATWAGFVTTAGITGFAADKFAFNTTNFLNTLNGTFNVSQDGNNLNLNYVTNYVIPEPKAALLGGLGLLLLLRRRR